MTMLSENARKLAQDAKRKGMWLYDPGYKKWYSPEDFMHIYNFADAKDDYLKTLQIRHPQEGIDAGFKKVSEMQTKLSYFTKAVFEYYQK